MLLVRVWVDTGIVTPFDPRPYEPQWFMHREEEHYLNWVTKVAVEIPEVAARAGDVVLWMFGRAYSHAGILVSKTAITHASGGHRKCTRSDLNTAWLQQAARAETPEDARLAYIGKGTPKLRPRKFFNVFEGIRQWQD
jgi:cell wall-associated NlpC family hydrolase